MVQSAGDWWLERQTMSREAVTDYLTYRISSYLRETREPALIFIDEAARKIERL